MSAELVGLASGHVTGDYMPQHELFMLVSLYKRKVGGYLLVWCYLGGYAVLLYFIHGMLHAIFVVHLFVQTFITPIHAYSFTRTRRVVHIVNDASNSHTAPVCI